MQCYDKPYREPSEDETDRKWWKCEDLWCGSDEARGTLHDCDTDSDVLPVAEDAADHESTNAPDNVRSIEIVLLVLFILWFCHFLRSVK